MSIKELIKLYLVTDPDLVGNRELEEVVVEAVKGGVTIVQLREKKLEDKQLIEKSLSLAKKLKKYSVPLIINDKIDVAFSSSASGVHLGQSDLPCFSAREVLGKHRIIGVSTNSIQEAETAVRDGADYIAISPIFDTPTKTDTDPAVGLDGIAEIKKHVKIPIVGIGGINVKNARDVIKAGCDGIAVVSAIIAAEDPKQAAIELLEEIEKGLKERNS